MQSFHNSLEVKRKYVAAAAERYDYFADELLRLLRDAGKA
jgi:hypothetical protein